MSLRPQGGFLLAVASPHPPLRGTLSREEKVDIDSFSLEGEGGRRPDEGADYGALAEKETSLASTADELVASSVANLCDVISCMKVRDMTERMSRRLSPCPELLESRTLATLVFVLNGNAFAGASPSIQTQVAAADLARRGDRAIQLSYPNMNSVGAFDQLAGQIQQISRGQPIGLIGFSAGGTLALRLSRFSSLNVKAVLDFYGPPDLANWISQHRGDSHARHVLSNINGNQISLMP